MEQIQLYNELSAVNYLERYSKQIYSSSGELVE